MPAAPNIRFETIGSVDRLRHVLGMPGPLGLDCETVGIDPRVEAPAHRGRIFCWSLAYRDGTDVVACYIPSALLTSDLQSVPVVGHNIHGFDRHMFANHGISLNVAADTMRMSKLLRPSREVKHGLKDLAKYRLGIEQPSYASLFSRPAHVLETVDYSDKKKHELLDDYRNCWRTKRKIDGVLGIPTLLISGEIGRIYKTTELIPLDEIEEHYPQRFPALQKYAALDAAITLLLYEQFSHELRQTRHELGTSTITGGDRTPAPRAATSATRTRPGTTTARYATR